MHRFYVALAAIVGFSGVACGPIPEGIPEQTDQVRSDLSAAIVNGSFEADSFSYGGTLDLGGANPLTGWTTYTNGVYPWGLPNANTYNAGPTPYGNQWVIVGNYGEGGTWIEQTVEDLSPGQTYTLTFALATEYGSSGEQAAVEVSFPAGSNTPSKVFAAPARISNYWDNWSSFSTPFEATNSAVAVRFKGLAGPGYDAGIDNVRIQPAACSPGSPITGVVLPRFVVPLSLPTKPWQVAYGELPVPFTAVDAPAGAICRAQSDVGSLPVLVRPAAGVGVGPFVLFATSTTSATVTIWKPSAVTPPEPCNFLLIGGRSNNCTINGSVTPDPDAYYFKWESPGFTTTFVTALPQPLSTGPLTFWVNLRALGLSPENQPTDSIVRIVESYVHVKLIQDLPSISAYTIIQDPGHVALGISDAEGRISGRAPNSSTVENGILGAIYYDSLENPGLVMAGVRPGIYRLNVTGIETGPFLLSAATIALPSGQSAESTHQGFASRGAVLAFDVTVPLAATPALFTPRPDRSSQELVTLVRASVHHHGLSQSLTAKLDRVQRACGSAGACTHSSAALSALDAFIHEVKGQTGKKIPHPDADKLVGFAESIRQQIHAAL